MKIRTKLIALGLLIPATALTPQAAAQTPEEASEAAPQPGGPPARPTIFDGDWISVGVGAAYSSSYDGSDDYGVSVLPIVQGSLGGVDISPRAGGLALDFVPDAKDGPGFDAGIAMRVRSSRASDIKDPVVATLGKLDTAIEIGPSVGISFPRQLNPFDSVSIGLDVRRDVAGAHGGIVLDPSIGYFTPLSRSMIASLTLGAEYGDDSFADHYYSVSPAQSVVSGLPAYQADGGFNKASATLLLGADLDGDVTNGGFSLVGLLGYSRLLGDAKRTPLTSVRGSANQWLVAGGVSYTF